MGKGNESQRRYDLDWIRVLATLFVFLYHTTMFFNPFPWHVKNNVIDTSFIYGFSLFVGNWIMPIFFAVSGISTFYALQKRSGKAFLKERFLRLGIPLLFGVFLLSPPQVFMERVSHNQFSGSLLSFLPHYFDGVYLDIGGTGNFAFVGLHLWYLLVLLLFSFITLPFLLKKSKTEGKETFGYKHYILLFFPLFVLAVTLNDVANLGGWGIFFYLVVYLYGYYFFKRESFRKFVRKTGILTGSLAIISSICFVVWGLHGFPENGTISSLILTFVRVVAVWNWLFFIFCLGEKYLMFSNNTLKYTSEASMPFYVVHQPIIVTLAFFIYKLNWSITEKFVFLVPTAFVIIICLYHFVIKRMNFLRIVFGMRKR